MSDDLVKRFDEVRQAYGAGQCNVEGAGVLAEVAARIEAQEALIAEAGRLVSEVQKLGLRELVAGWNGEDRPQPYKPHDGRLSATIKTTCGTVYAIDEITRALLAKLPGGR